MKETKYTRCSSFTTRVMKYVAKSLVMSYP